MRPGGLCRIHHATSLASAASIALPGFPPTTFPPPAFRCFRPGTPRAGSGSMDSTTMLPPGVAVRDPKSLEEKKTAIRCAGPSKLQARSLIFCPLFPLFRVNGVGSDLVFLALLWLASHGLLQQGNAEYDAKRQALYEYYHPLEISPTIPIEEKTKLMEEWYADSEHCLLSLLDGSKHMNLNILTTYLKIKWEKSHGLLIEGGLTYDAIKKSVSEATIALRDGVVELFELLEEIAALVLPPGVKKEHMMTGKVKNRR
ncbi:hypothetical protein BHM03_00006210 [Ensete ventricosum]|nr:hypothetical protein BHM03_00006210 [Ensete ventricosum]